MARLNIYLALVQLKLMGTVLLTDTGADAVKPTLNPLEKDFSTKIGRKQVMSCGNFYKLSKNHFSTKNMWCGWNGAWVYRNTEEQKPARVVLEGCSEWKEPKLASSIHAFGVNTLYPDFVPKTIIWLVAEGHSSTC